MVEGTTSTSVASESDEAFLGGAHIAGLLERFRREPALRAWVLTAPTGALATLGVVLDDQELVLLLERIEALDDRARAFEREAELEHGGRGGLCYAIAADQVGQADAVALHRQALQHARKRAFVIPTDPAPGVASAREPDHPDGGV